MWPDRTEVDILREYQRDICFLSQTNKQHKQNTFTQSFISVFE